MGMRATAVEPKSLFRMIFVSTFASALRIAANGGLGSRGRRPATSRPPQTRRVLQEGAPPAKLRWPWICSSRALSGHPGAMPPGCYNAQPKRRSTAGQQEPGRCTHLTPPPFLCEGIGDVTHARAARLRAARKRAACGRARATCAACVADGRRARRMGDVRKKNGSQHARAQEERLAGRSARGWAAWGLSGACDAGSARAAFNWEWAVHPQAGLKHISCIRIHLWAN